MSLQPYKNYKKVDLNFANEIPIDWDVKRIKLIFNFNKNLVGKASSDYPVLSLTTKGVIKRDIESGMGKFPASFDGYQIVNPNSIMLCLFDMDVTPRLVGHVDDQGIISAAYTNIIPKKGINSKYYYYYFLLQEKNKSFLALGTGIRITLSKDVLGCLQIPVPPLEVQNSIVEYLDKKNHAIDKCIQNKQKLIALLEEQKAITINQAVVKGLDRKAQMKDSGIEWLGEIPKHWNLKKLRYLGTFQNGISAGAEYFGSGYPFISYSDVYKNIALPDFISDLANSSKEDRIRFSVLEGDVFFTRTSETIEEIGFTSICNQTIKDATFSGFLIRFRPFKGLLYKGYSKYYFRSNLHRRFFVKEMNLVTRASLGQGLLKNLPVIIPPYDEQKDITKFIDKKLGDIDLAISKAQKEIELIKEYRETLITDLVTGKRSIPQTAKN
jgi:type I restriction enzyme S subunit